MAEPDDFAELVSSSSVLDDGAAQIVPRSAYASLSTKLNATRKSPPSFLDHPAPPWTVGILLPCQVILPALAGELDLHAAVSPTVACGGGQGANAASPQRKECQTVRDLKMDIDDIRAQFGTKYDDQIKEMMESLEQNKSFQAYKTISGGSGC